MPGEELTRRPVLEAFEPLQGPVWGCPPLCSQHAMRGGNGPEKNLWNFDVVPDRITLVVSGVRRPAAANNLAYLAETVV